MKTLEAAPGKTFGSSLNYRVARVEYLAAFAVCAALFLYHVDEIRWLPAILLFAYIDVIGYLPGLVAYKRSPDGFVPDVYHHLYNATHNLVSGAVVVGLWCVLVRPEWAVLAVPLHLLGDRALLGNFAKPIGTKFE
jgi:hypothetical protein